MGSSFCSLDEHDKFFVVVQDNHVINEVLDSKRDLVHVYCVYVDDDDPRPSGEGGDLLGRAVMMMRTGIFWGGTNQNLIRPSPEDPQVLSTSGAAHQFVPPQIRKWIPPQSVPMLKHAELNDFAQNCRSRLFIVCFIASWDPQTRHANRAMEVAQAFARKHNKDIQFALVEMAERGALISNRRYENQLAKQYKVQCTPWLLIFSGGVVIQSGKLTGFVDKLRFETFAKPRALLVEPVGTVVGRGIARYA